MLVRTRKEGVEGDGEENETQNSASKTAASAAV